MRTDPSESTPSRFQPNHPPCGQTRREFLWQTAGGFTSLPLIALLSRDGFFERTAHAAEGPGKSHFPAKAKRVVFFFMNGGPSQVDTFDPKPALARYQGKSYKTTLQIGSNGRSIGYPAPSAFTFTKHGESGLEISSLYPHVSRFADDLCVIRSMHADTPTHSPGILQMNSGSVVTGKPSLGSWLSYGLGADNENLPSFVVMIDPRGGPRGGAAAWSSGFMPAVYQGTMFRSVGSPLLDLATPPGVAASTQRRGIDLLEKLNRRHLKSRPGDSELVARIRSYELAYRMQTSAAEAVDLESESTETKDLYGVSDKPTADFGRKCLMARRMVEAGIRFIEVMVTVGAGTSPFDNHGNLKGGLEAICPRIDKPSAGLIQDLKQRGLLDTTLVLWTGEFGRLPISQRGDGRDHNRNAFTLLAAGGGFKPGYTHGATDELGYKSVEDRVSVHDLHADPEVTGARVVKEILV